LLKAKAKDGKNVLEMAIDRKNKALIEKLLKVVDKKLKFSKEEKEELLKNVEIESLDVEIQNSLRLFRDR
jgi:hypothetical protein